MFLDMQEHLERYSEEQIEAMMDEIDQVPDVETAWQTFEKQRLGEHGSEIQERISAKVYPSRRRLQVAATFIGILMISGIAFAAVHFVRNMGNRSVVREPQSLSVEAGVSDLSQQSDTTIIQPVVFDNVTLEALLPEIAKHYGYTVSFRSDQSKTLRLFLTWNPQDSIQNVTEKLNLFEQINIVLDGRAMIVE
jgi:hypothetical protein